LKHNCVFQTQQYFHRNSLDRSLRQLHIYNVANISEFFLQVPTYNSNLIKMFTTSNSIYESGTCPYKNKTVKDRRHNIILPLKFLHRFSRLFLSRLKVLTLDCRPWLVWENLPEKPSFLSLFHYCLYSKHSGLCIPQIPLSLCRLMYLFPHLPLSHDFYSAFDAQFQVTSSGEPFLTPT
jgi:hypothetical protein